MAHIMKIPKTIHIIWVGDESKRPEDFIQTWKDNHPSWTVNVWGNYSLNKSTWRCQKQIDAFANAGMWHGVADIMRYEILSTYGGVYVDADSISVRPLDEEFLNNSLFAVYESEVHVPKLIANGFIGSIPGHPALEDIVEHISSLNDPLNKLCFRWYGLKRRRVPAWKSVGPKLFSRILKKHVAKVTIFPSIMFLPQHYKDTAERSGGPIYARHVWGKTFDKY